MAFWYRPLILFKSFKTASLLWLRFSLAMSLSKSSNSFSETEPRVAPLAFKSIRACNAIFDRNVCASILNSPAAVNGTIPKIDPQKPVVPSVFLTVFNKSSTVSSVSLAPPAADTLARDLAICSFIWSICILIAGAISGNA